ncbi:hypothetical protein JKP88DRAFT_243870 [Tribonema minus]|uniref:HNH nuclease domain-containing protein n=1 Tax=Tribonema minus TaxID=303371 RepID=A0A835Z513_9STRA|nr:hypothetical protein JKP88DRAFT_243870 [Tribonema minus]
MASPKPLVTKAVGDEHRDTRVLMISSTYSATSDGHIINNRTGKRLAERRICGYSKVTFKVKGKAVPRAVHVLVWTAFNYRPVPRGMSIDHINRVRDDNRLVNLRLATAVQQVANSESRVGRSRPIMHRAITVSKGGTVSVFPRMDETLLRSIAPTSNPTTAMRKVYAAMKTGGTAYGYTFAYAPSDLLEGSSHVWKEIPPTSIKGATGYYASDTGFIKTP